jgi:RNA polymerase sigma factor (TIGR02999 family)
MAPGQFTLLLKDWSGGNKAALDSLTPIVYQELRKLASSKLSRERDARTLQPTALIHEAYLKLVQHDQERWHSRAHFFAVASHIMREILVDHARKHSAAKRSGERVPIEEGLTFAPERGAMVIALDDALGELAKFDERKARLIELRYFGGLSGEELADALNISISTVTRESRLAEAWLHRYLTGAT